MTDIIALLDLVNANREFAPHMEEYQHQADYYQLAEQDPCGMEEEGLK